MASEYNTDRGQGYRIPRRRRPNPQPPPPPAGMTYRPPSRAVSEPPPPPAGMAHRVHPALRSAPAAPFTGPTRRDQRVLRRYERRQKRSPTPYPFSSLARAMGATSGGAQDPLYGLTLTTARGDTMYANPLHTDYANFTGSLGRLLRRLGRNPIDAEPIAPNPDPSIAWTNLESDKVGFEPAAYGGFGKDSDKRFIKDIRDRALSVGLHESVHTDQPLGRPVWLDEGEAEYRASRMAGSQGIDYSYAGGPYPAYLRRYRSDLAGQGVR